MLNIIYRLCELETDGNIRPFRPRWYSKQNCLTSFLNSVNISKNHINSVTFVHDGGGDTLLNMIPSEFKIVKINDHSNLLSLRKTFEVASSVGGNIYFVEDDYLHLPKSIEKISQALPDLKLLTGYDHVDRYVRNDDIDYHKHVIFHRESNIHWRTSESTCCTYAVEENTYKRIEHIIKSYELQDRELFRRLHMEGVPLWTPLPGLTTQVDPCMSPGIDWEQFNKNI
jgi:hypothetical protein